MRKHAILLLLSIPLLFSCTKKEADLIFFNGNVYTVNNGFDIVQALAVKEGRIIATGTTKDLLDRFESDESIDLQGKTVYPGFIDAHCHFFGYASDLLKCNLTGTASFHEALSKLREFSTTNKFEWLLGRGWDQNDWPGKAYPTRQELDSLFPDQPVFLMRIDGHAALCNGSALRRAKITATTRIHGGEIVLQNGVPTGLLIDNAVELVKSAIPPFTDELNGEALIRAQKNCFAAGLTTLVDAGLGKDSIELIQRMQQDGELKIRIYAMISETKATRDYFFRRGPLITDRLTVRAVKVYGDGALGSRGACLKQPYSDRPGHYGFLLNSKKYFDDIADEALESGFQLCTHAIGDSAVRIMLDVYESHLAPSNNRRWRIEHCQVVDQPDMKRFGKLAVIPSVQPTHATSDMYWAEERLGEERLKNSYAYRELLNKANTIAFGTDFPVEEIDPLRTFYAAVARKDASGWPEKGFLPENKLKRKDVLRAMTINAAYSNFEEQVKGSIEPGKMADLVILDKDLLKVEEENILNVKVQATYVAGERVYSLGQ